MAIPFKHGDVAEGVLYEILDRLQAENGHEAVLAKLTNQAAGVTGRHLLCDCDYAADRGVDDGCPVKEQLRERWRQAAKAAHGQRWAGLTLVEAVADIYGLHNGGTYLGTHHGDLLYVQEVAALLGQSVKATFAACLALRDQERLDLTGMILVDYTPGFRFPVELRELLRYMIEEPCGWPNGDAGECFLANIETAIGEGSHYPTGRDAFEFGGNWPHLQPHILAMFGLAWLQQGIERDDSGDAGYRQRLAAALRELLERVEKGG